MISSAKVAQLPAGTKGFDCFAPPDDAALSRMKQQGFRFAVLYCDVAKREDCDRVLRSGLALMLVQTGNRPGWLPGEEGRWGSVRGGAAERDAAELGYLPGACLWCDVESLNPKASADDLVAYDNAWADTVSKAGFIPGRYEGCDAVLNGEQLYHRLKYQHYWRSASKVPDVAHRGYQVLQGGTVKVSSKWSYDPDTVQADRLGGLPLAVVPNGWQP